MTPLSRLRRLPPKGKTLAPGGTPAAAAHGLLRGRSTVDALV